MIRTEGVAMHVLYATEMPASGVPMVAKGSRGSPLFPGIIDVYGAFAVLFTLNSAPDEPVLNF
jgi:hypothetical protein